jgi:hypothetical protein
MLQEITKEEAIRECKKQIKCISDLIKVVSDYDNI